MSELNADLIKRMRIEPTLSDCEHKIERAIFAYAEAGEALGMIRDKKLYKDTHKTFEAYCRDRWGWSRSYVHRTIEAGAVHDSIYEAAKTLPIGNKLEPPRTEAAARELAPLRKEPKVLTEVWTEVVERHGPDVTARQVKKAVAEVIPTKGSDPAKAMDSPERKAREPKSTCRVMLDATFDLWNVQQRLMEEPVEDGDRVRIISSAQKAQRLAAGIEKLITADGDLNDALDEITKVETPTIREFPVKTERARAMADSAYEKFAGGVGPSFKIPGDFLDYVPIERVIAGMPDHELPEWIEHIKKARRDLEKIQELLEAVDQ